MRAIAFSLLTMLVAAGGDGKARSVRTEVHTPGPLEWEPGTDKPKKGCETVLIFLTEYLRARPEVTKFRFEVAGELAERRALYIAKWFLVHNIDCKRLAGVASDKQELKTIFTNAEIRGKPTGPDPGGKQLPDLCQVKVP